MCASPSLLHSMSCRPRAKYTFIHPGREWHVGFSKSSPQLLVLYDSYASCHKREGFAVVEEKCRALWPCCEYGRQFGPTDAESGRQDVHLTRLDDSDASFLEQTPAGSVAATPMTRTTEQPGIDEHLHTKALWPEHVA
jgi:hypothetical protein